MGETYIPVGGKWRSLWREIDANGQLVHFRRTIKRNAKAAKALLDKVVDRVRLLHPFSIFLLPAVTLRMQCSAWILKG